MLLDIESVVHTEQNEDELRSKNFSEVPKSPILPGTRAVETESQSSDLLNQDSGSIDS